MAAGMSGGRNVRLQSAGPGTPSPVRILAPLQLGPAKTERRGAQVLRCAVAPVECEPCVVRALTLRIVYAAPSILGSWLWRGRDTSLARTRGGQSTHAWDIVSRA